MSETLYTLHHYPLDPPSRRVRMALAEKDIGAVFVSEKPWEPRAEYLAINPAGEVPTLVIEDKEKEQTSILSYASPICEYLEELIPSPNFLGATPLDRAEVRRLTVWFEQKMFRDATGHFLEEKALKRLQGKGGSPDSARLHTGYNNIHGHMSYICWLVDQRNWLAGDTITAADFAAAAQLSVIDYLGDVPWDKHPSAKEWYARIKSRPSFRSILGDHIPGLMPPRHYADLDF